MNEKYRYYVRVKIVIVFATHVDMSVYTYVLKKAIDKITPQKSTSEKSFCQKMEYQSLQHVQVVQPLNNDEFTTTNRLLNFKNMSLFICFFMMILSSAIIIITMMLLGSREIPSSLGRDFLFISSIIIGVFMILLTIVSIFARMTKSICANILFFGLFMFYTIVNFGIAITYFVFFYMEPKWKTNSYLVVAFLFYMTSLVQCMCNGKEDQ